MSYNKVLYFSQNATTFVMNLPVAYNLLLHLIELITLVCRMYFVVSCGSKLLRITDRGAVSLSSSSKLNRHSLRNRAFSTNPEARLLSARCYL